MSFNSSEFYNRVDGKWKFFREYEPYNGCCPNLFFSEKSLLNDGVMHNQPLLKDLTRYITKPASIFKASKTELFSTLNRISTQTSNMANRRFGQ